MTHLPTTAAAGHADTAYLTLDESPDGSPLGVINFRTTSSVPADGARPHLRSLHHSGSSQFDARGLATLRAALAKPLQDSGCRHLHVLDLRQERHGLMGERALGMRTRGNQGSGDASQASLLAHEARWLAELGGQPAGTPVTAWWRNHDRLETCELPAAPTLSEAALLATRWQPAAGADAVPTWHVSCGYTRLPMLDGAEVPPDASVEMLVQLVREELPRESWLHMHCLHGHGRTSLFLLLCDILKSAAKEKLKHIVARERELPQAQAPDTAATQRFLRRFHRYCRETDGVIHPEPWSTWHAREARLWGLLRPLRRALCLD